MFGKIYLLNRKKKEINKNSLNLRGEWDQHKGYRENNNQNIRSNNRL